MPCSSEVPFHPGLIPDEFRKDDSGLYMVLIQSSNCRTRALRGRYLHVRVELKGDTRSTPELYALRVYAPRFSYLNHYLPDLYKETLYGPEAGHPDAISVPKPATPSDFLERFLDNFEGILTDLELSLIHI